MRWTLVDPPRLPLIAPSILSADFATLGRECENVLRGGADLLHVDVMDGHFVPNLTMGPALVEKLHAALPSALLDVHLMVTDPGQYIRAFAEAGAGHITFNIEPAVDRRSGTGLSPGSAGFAPDALMDRIRELGMTAGFAINPGTPIEAVERWIEDADMVLVMSVEPGYAGQSFKPEVLPKVREVKSRLRPNQRLEMDGGISPQTAPGCREAGCDVLVAATAIFGRRPAERSVAIAQLRE